MKLLFLLPLLLCYCSTTNNGSAKVVTTSDNNLQIKCDTQTEGSCMETAMARCGGNGYNVVDKKTKIELLTNPEAYTSEPTEYTYLTVSCR